MGESNKTQKPRYMEKLLEQLGWNQGTRIPLASPENQELENILIDRQNEIQRLKEALILQNQKQEDLSKYKEYVQTEYQENTRILFAQKHQLEQEVKLRELAANDAKYFERDVLDCQKKSQNLSEHIDRYQDKIAKLLKRADDLKSEVCGERVALQEWRASIERSAGDIDAIERFTKQDLSKAKELEYQRQKLKMEHDRVHERLTQVVGDLSAEERSCENISKQVIESIEQRERMMRMWMSAVENLRNRDTDIRHIREDYAVLENEANNVAEQCREHQAFYEQQKANNAEAERANTTLLQKLGTTNIVLMRITEQNVNLDSELKSFNRVLANVTNKYEKCRAENRSIMERQQKKDYQLSQLNQKLRDLKFKLTESVDQTKSAEKRANQLEEMLNEEERYASQLTTNQQRASHCSYAEQQKLLALKNEEKLIMQTLQAEKAVMSKLDTKQADWEKKLQSLKETLYIICYQVETVGARVLHIEGNLDDRSCKAELLEKENRLKKVMGRHAARVSLLERHSARLQDDMRRLAREIDTATETLVKMKSRLKTSAMNVEGGDKELKEKREIWRRERVEEALMRLRVTTASRALASIETNNYTLEMQRLQLEAAMDERMVEIAARRDLFMVQKRALLEDCSRLRVDIKEREGRIEQLIKRYDIFIASLGKDENGEQVSITFFKIKFAAERAELRERGALLDADINRREKDVSALEATMKVVAAAHDHFMHHTSPLADDTAEMEELRALTDQFYKVKDESKVVKADLAVLEDLVNELRSKKEMLSDKNQQLIARESEAESELENARERRRKQEIRLQNAHDVVKYNLKRAKKLIEGVDDWRIFQLALWVRDYGESAHNALQALNELCASDEAKTRFAALLSSTDLQRHMTNNQRRLLSFVQRLVGDDTRPLKEKPEIEESMFSSSQESSRSGASIASGFTRRFMDFRQTLARKVQEPAMLEEIADKVRRSTVSLRVVTLGMEESATVAMASEISRLSSTRRGGSFRKPH